MSDFPPHAIIICENRIPSPIFVAAILGVDKLLRIDFPTAIGAEEYVDFALRTVSARLQHWGGSVIPAFGKPTAIVVNYSSVHAIKYDLVGNIVDHLPVPLVIGEAILTV